MYHTACRGCTKDEQLLESIAINFNTSVATFASRAVDWSQLLLLTMTEQQTYQWRSRQIDRTCVTPSAIETSSSGGTGSEEHDDDARLVAFSAPHRRKLVRVILAGRTSHQSVWSTLVPVWGHGEALNWWGQYWEKMRKWEFMTSNWWTG